MVVDPNLTLTNSSIILSTPHTDYGIFIIIFLLSFAFLTLSIIRAKNLEKITFAIIAILLSISSAFASLSVATVDFDTVGYAENETNYYAAIYPVSENWITIICVILSIISILALIDGLIRLTEEIDEIKISNKRRKSII